MDPLFIPNSIFSFVSFVCLIKLQRIIHCIDGICTWVLCLFLLMSIFTITQTYRISIIIFSPCTQVLYYMHYPFFLVCPKQAILYRSFYCFIADALPLFGVFQSSFFLYLLLGICMYGSWLTWGIDVHFV